MYKNVYFCTTPAWNVLKYEIHSYFFNSKIISSVVHGNCKPSLLRTIEGPAQNSLHVTCHAIGDNKKWTKHVIGKVRMTDSLKKAHYRNTTVDSRMLRTQVTDTLQMIGSNTFFLSNQHHDWRATHCLRATGMSLDSAARQIKQLPLTDSFLSGPHRQMLYMTGRRQYTLTVAVNWRRTPRSSMYGKTRMSLLGLFGVVTTFLIYSSLTVKI
jgi:hypothetical protein